MANTQLDTFLADGAAEAGAQPAPAPEPKAAPVESTPAPKTDTKAPEAASKPAEKTAPEPDDTEPPEALAGEPVIPRRAYEDERRKRQDYKAQAARAEGELAALKKQLEDGKRAAEAPPPPPQPQYQPPPMPDFNSDPHGFMQAYAAREEQKRLNDRLNTSELFVADKIGREKLDAYVQDFKQMAQADPALYQKLYAQAHPYGWLQGEVDRLRLLRDVGDDPAAYRAKIEAEARARWEAERGQTEQPAPVSPAAGLQPSLATARSAGARNEVWSGEPSLEELVRPIQSRKAKNGIAPRF